MANLQETATYEVGIYQIETSDVVLGGPDGLTNVPIKQLANRTAWLKEAIEARAPKASPALTGTPTAPTAPNGTNTEQLATTAFVQTALANVTFASATTTTKGAVELATEMETTTGTDATRAVTPAGLKAVADTKAPKASPALTGTPTAPTAPNGTNTEQLATTAFVQTAVANGTTPDATTTTKGKVELATTTETTAGTDATRAVTPAGLKTVADEKLDKSGGAITGDINVNGNALTSINRAVFEAAGSIASTAGAINIDFSAKQNYIQAEPTGAITYTITGLGGVGSCHLVIDSDGANTAQTFTFPASVIWLNDWTPEDNLKGFITFFFDGTNTYAMGANEVAA